MTRCKMVEDVHIEREKEKFILNKISRINLIKIGKVVYLVSSDIRPYTNEKSQKIENFNVFRIVYPKCEVTFLYPNSYPICY